MIPRASKSAANPSRHEPTCAAKNTQKPNSHFHSENAIRLAQKNFIEELDRRFTTFARISSVRKTAPSNAHATSRVAPHFRFVMVNRFSQIKSASYMRLFLSVSSSNMVNTGELRSISQLRLIKIKICPSVLPSIHPSVHPSIHPSVTLIFPNFGLIKLSLGQSQDRSIQVILGVVMVLMKKRTKNGLL